MVRNGPKKKLSSGSSLLIKKGRRSSIRSPLYAGARFAGEMTNDAQKKSDRHNVANAKNYKTKFIFFFFFVFSLSLSPLYTLSESSFGI